MRFDIVHPVEITFGEDVRKGQGVPQIPQIVNDPHAILLMWNIIYLLVALALFAWQTARLGTAYSLHTNPLVRHAIKELKI